MVDGNIKLKLSDEVRQRMLERHISEDEIKQVIQNAEATGRKAYQTDTNLYLASLWIDRATFYVEYLIEDGTYSIVTTYAHRAEIKE